MYKKFKLFLSICGYIHFIALHSSLKMMAFKSALLLNTAGNLGYSYIQDYIKYRDIPTYTFNYMVLNRDEKCSYLYPANNRNEACKVLEPLFKIAAVTPKNKARVVLWYDSCYTSQETIQDIKNQIMSYRYKHLNHAPIVVRDIRSLDQVKKNPDAFSSSFPVFFRADLARVIATLEMLEKGKESYFVYSDMDLDKPLGPEKLFSPSIKTILDQYGIVVKGYKGEEDVFCENQFHIVSKYDKEIRQALQFAVVDLAFHRAKTIPVHKRKFLGESVWTSYRDMLEYLYSLKKWGTLWNWGKYKPYNKEVEGLKPFDIDIGKQRLVYNLKLMTGENGEPSLPVTFEPSYPPRCFNYNWI